MNRILLLLVGILSGSICHGQDLVPSGRSRLPAKERIRADKGTNAISRLKAFHEFLDQKGGLLVIPVSGPPMKLVDATKKGLLSSCLNLVKRKFDEFKMCPMVVLRQTGDRDAYHFGLKLAKEASGVVLLVDGHECPSACEIYPEEHLAVVNIDVLLNGVTGSGRRQDRIEKQVWRAIGHICGVGAPEGYQCVMQSMRSLQDIDMLPIKFIHPSSFYKARSYFTRMGVSPTRKGTYEAAVKQGWAPAPTNDIQKAIWDKAHAEKERGPSNPIQIKP